MREARRPKVTCKDRSIVEQQADAVVRMTWRGDYLTRDADARQKRADRLAGEHDVVVRGEPANRRSARHVGKTYVVVTRLQNATRLADSISVKVLTSS